MVTWLEKQIGWLLATAALIWAIYYLASAREFHTAYLRLGPMQLLLAGVLLWLHGKYRASHADHHDLSRSVDHLRRTA